jgi:hypothetical protein
VSRLDDAIDLLDIEDWLSEYVDIKKSGFDEIKLSECPKCGSDKYKLYVNTDSKRWICHKCNFGKGLSDVCVLMAAVSERTVHDIRMELLSVVVPVPSNFISELTRKLDSNKQVLDEEEVEVVQLPGQDSFRGILGQRVEAYLSNRGVSTNPMGIPLRMCSKLRGFNGPFALFPIYYGSDAVGWQGRRLENKEPRYVSSDGIGNWLWPLSDSVSNFNFKDKEVILVEGVFDALGVYSIGLTALCTFGKKISTNQINILTELGVKKVCIAWDKDATLEIEKAALKLSKSFEVSVVDFDTFQIDSTTKVDAGDVLVKEELKPWLQEILSKRVKVTDSKFFNWRLRTALNGKV